MLTSPKENVTLGPGIKGEDEARQQCGWQCIPEPPAAWTQRCLQGQPWTMWTVEAAWCSGAGTVVTLGCLRWRAKPATPQVGAQARWPPGRSAGQHVRDSPVVGFGETPKEGRVLRS